MARWHGCAVGGPLQAGAEVGLRDAAREQPREGDADIAVRQETVNPGRIRRELAVVLDRVVQNLVGF